MPFDLGGDLLGWIQATPPDDSSAKAIMCLHASGIWHWDIKRENLLMMEHRPLPDCAVLADFAFSRLFTAGFCDNRFPGTLFYVPPEQIGRHHGMRTLTFTRF
jgi:serine/threonine protein kinase